MSAILYIKKYLRFLHSIHSEKNNIFQCHNNSTSPEARAKPHKLSVPATFQNTIEHKTIK